MVFSGFIRLALRHGPAGFLALALAGAVHAEPLAIHTVQGDGIASPYVGHVVQLEGIVTAILREPTGAGGFYLQAPAAEYDQNPVTSEGLFVQHDAGKLTVGDRVRLSGAVAESGTAPKTRTQLTAVTKIDKLGRSALPPALALALPFANATQAERYEGMRVVLPQNLTVTDTYGLGRFGTLVLSDGRLPVPTNIVLPGAAATAQSKTNRLNRLAVNDGIDAPYPNPTPFLADSNRRGLTRRTGSTVQNATGILDEKFSSYVLEPTAPLRFVDANPRDNPPALAGTLRVAIGNVLNFFNGDGTGGGFPTPRGANTPAEYERQRAKIVASIVAIQPDIMGLTEVENDRVTNGAKDSYGPTSALADIVRALNATAPAGTTYAYVNAAAVDIVSDEIRCAFIYRVETVALAGAPALLDDPAFNGLARNPLAQTFREIATGEKLTIAINHFKSKGSASVGPAATDGLEPNPNLDQGDGQANSNYVRKKQARALARWLATDPTHSGDPDFLILGDLNAYAKEDPLTLLESAGYVNLTERSEGPGGYSYVYAAESGHLDHALANRALAPQVVGAVTWHVNSDEPAYYDYNVENKTPAQQALNVDTPYRYSDHDPVIVGLKLRSAAR